MKPCIIRLACAIAAVLSLGLLSCSQKEENTPAGGVDSITLNERDIAPYSHLDSLNGERDRHMVKFQSIGSKRE